MSYGSAIDNARLSVERFTAAELLPAVSSSGAGWYVAAETRKNASLQLPRNGGGQQEFRAISIHPRSQIRALAVYLDDEIWPRSVVGGQVLRAQFRYARIEPLEDAPRNLGSAIVGWTDAQTSGAAPVSCQLGAVCLWVDDPCVAYLPIGNRVQVVQDLVSGAAYTPPGSLAFAHVLTCGAVSATVGVTNRNVANPAALNHDVYQAEPAVRGTASPVAFACLFPTAAATLALAAAASANLSAVTTITNPTSSLVVVQGSSASAGVYRSAVLVSLLYPQGSP